MNKPTKAEQLEFLRNKLATNQAWAERALVRIYDYQTEQEKSADCTNWNNGVGFTGNDAKFLSGCAKTVLYRGHVTEKQLPYVLKKMKKYARQIQHHPAFSEEKLIAAMTK